MAETKKKPGFFKNIGMQTVAGGSAGFMEVLCMQPLDIVKLRIQLQNNQLGGANNYNGVFDCFRKIYAQEGLLAFWKGLLPPIIVETPKRAIKFVGFEQFKVLFTFNKPKPTPLTFALAGLCAGFIEGFIVSPFELVKIAQQANREVAKESRPGPLVITKQIINTEGLAGLSKGLTACILRNGIFGMVYFGFYHNVKNIMPEYKDATLEFLRKSSIAFVSGSLACVFNIPFDMIKSRIQGPQPVPGEVKYKTTLNTYQLIKKEEGFRALFKGLTPKVMRLGPGGAIMMFVFEHVYEFLQERFPS